MNQNEWSFQDDEEAFNLALSQRTDELYRVPNLTPDEDGIIEALVLPLRDLVIFPHMVTPIFVARQASMLAIQEAHSRTRTVIGLTQRDPEVEDPRPQDFLPIGVEIAVGRLLSMPDGSSSALVQGRRRVEILEFTRLEPVIKVRARVFYEATTADRQTQALMRSVLDLFDRCIQLDRSIPEEAHLFALNIVEPGWLSDMITTAVSFNFEERQALLLMTDPHERLKRIKKLLAEEVDVLELEDEIHSRVQNEVDKSQREFYLREQMKAIQTELGEGDIWTRDVNELRQRIEQAHLPEQARVTAMKEIERLNQMPPMAPEVGIIRSYIDWILDLPWSKLTEDNLDVKHAARVLERDHYGLKNAKER
ncbi:MAG: LON peptidase substrate-binding domain-containing protein, partial [Anaerolineales bacterium]|nr:LON peptidase substrate-binding domain-containing protein [Anaerolineales bacterium]